MKKPLKEGSVCCDKCAGTGSHGYSQDYIEAELHGMMLKIPTNKTEHAWPKCYGAGQLDWIENVVGKKPPIKHFINDCAIQSLYPHTINPIFIDYIDLIKP